MWLVGERRAVTAAEVPLNWSVWIALPADAIDEITARRGSPARVAGVLRVGLAEIGAGKSAAFTLEPAGLWMPRPEAEALGADYGADNDAEHDAEQRQ
jgi:hypothetical protein